MKMGILSSVHSVDDTRIVKKKEARCLSPARAVKLGLAERAAVCRDHDWEYKAGELDELYSNIFSSRADL
jgi:hypothetical protein